MIPLIDELQVAARLRANILSLVGGIRNSSGDWMSFDDSSANWLTSRRLSECLKDYENALMELGAVRVHLHAPCGAAEHENLAPHVYGNGGYWRYELEEEQFDFDLAADGRIFLAGMPMVTVLKDAVYEQGWSKRPCPCRPGKRAAGHQVSAYFLWPKKHDSRLGELVRLTLTLRDAINQSEDHRPRSGIRELLLQVLIKLDGLIVEENAEGVLAKRGIDVGRDLKG